MNYNERINKSDSIVKQTINEFLDRSEKGKIKYGVNLDRTDLIDVDYLQHLKEELCDAILYLNKFVNIKKNDEKLNEIVNDKYDI